MTAYTEGTLRKLSKKELIGITLSPQNKFNTFLKKVNTLFHKTVIDMERQCWKNSQYSKRECFEVVGIPRDVSSENLESKVLEVFSKVDCEILSRDIEVCHRLTNNNRVIAKFLERKDWGQVMSVKRDLQKVKLKDIELGESNSIVINRRLCSYCRMLRSKSKTLFDIGKSDITLETVYSVIQFNTKQNK